MFEFEALLVEANRTSPKSICSTITCFNSKYDITPIYNDYYILNKLMVKVHEMYHDLIDTDVDEENGEKVETMIFNLL